MPSAPEKLRPRVPGLSCLAKDAGPRARSRPKVPAQNVFAPWRDEESSTRGVFTTVVSEKKNIDVDRTRPLLLNALASHFLFYSQQFRHELPGLAPAFKRHGAIEKPCLIGELPPVRCCKTTKHHDLPKLPSRRIASPKLLCRSPTFDPNERYAMTLMVPEMNCSPARAASMCNVEQPLRVDQGSDTLVTIPDLKPSLKSCP